MAENPCPHPLVMSGLGPSVAMIIEPRYTIAAAQQHVGTDAALAVIVVALCWLIGWQPLSDFG
jgi:hypothetical protein